MSQQGLSNRVVHAPPSIPMGTTALRVLFLNNLALVSVADAHGNKERPLGEYKVQEGFLAQSSFVGWLQSEGVQVGPDWFSDPVDIGGQRWSLVRFTKPYDPADRPRPWYIRLWGWWQRVMDPNTVEGKSFRDSVARPGYVPEGTGPITDPTHFVAREHPKFGGKERP